MQLNNSNNSYSGGTVVGTTAAAVLKAGAANVLGTGSFNIGSGTFDLNGFSQTVSNTQGASNATITNSSGTAVLLTDTLNYGVTFNGNITGNLALSVTGGGGQYLTGDNTYTGNTTVSDADLDVNSNGTLANSPNLFVSGGGYLVWDDTIGNSTGVAHFLPTANLTLDGGSYDAVSSANSSNATLGVLTLAGGSSTITTGAGGNTTLNLKFSSLTRSAGATLDIFGFSLGTNTHIKFTTAPALQNGILPYVTINEADFATAGNGTDLVAFSGYVTTGNQAGWNATSNVKLTNVGNITIGSNVAHNTINSLILVGSNGTATIVNLNNNTLAIGNGTGQGGVLFAGNSSDTFSNGTLAFGSSEGIFQLDNSVLNNGVSANVTGLGGLTVGGCGTAGALVLSGTNTYSGNTASTAGILSIGSDANLGAVPGAATAGSLVLDGGTLQATANFTLNGNRGIALGPTIGAGYGTIDVTANKTLTLAGPLTSNTNGNGGLVKIDSGNLTLSAAGTYNGNTILSNGTLKDGILNATPTGTILIVNSPGVFDLNGFNQTVAGLVGAGNVTDTGANAALTLNDAGFTIYSGALNGNLALVLNGPGVQVLSGTAGSYAGTFNGNTTTVNGGTLQLGVANPVNAANFAVFNSGVVDLKGFGLTVNEVGGNGTLTNTAAAATLTFNNGAPHTTTANLTGNLGLTVNGQGETLSGNNSYTGNTLLTNGTLILASANALPSTTALVFGTTSTGTGLTLSGFDATIGSLQGGNATTGSISLGSNNLTVGTNNLTTTYSGNISGSGNLTKVGTGTLILTGNNTSSGGTTLSGGTLQIGNGGSGSLGSGNISDNAALVYDLSSNVTVASFIMGSGSLTQAGTGILTLTAANTYSGITTVSAGTLSISSDANLGTAPASATPAFLVLNGGTLQTTATFTLNANRGIALGPTSGSGSGTFDVTANQTLTVAGNVTNNGCGTGTLVKVDSGTLFLSGVNTYSGGTTISGGTVQGNVPGSNFTINGNYDLNGSNLTVLNLNGNGTITNSNATAAVLTDQTTNSQTFSGNLTGNLGLVETGNGILILTGNNTYSAGTTLSGGTLQIGSGGSSGSLGSGNISDNTALVYNLSSNVTVSNFIMGSGSLTQAGTGIVTLTAANTYSGSTTVNAGTLSISSDANLGTAPATATPAFLVLNGGTLQTTATFTLNANRGIALGPTSGSGSGTFDVTANQTLTVAGNVANNGSGTGSPGQGGQRHPDPRWHQHLLGGHHHQRRHAARQPARRQLHDQRQLRPQRLQPDRAESQRQRHHHQQ